MPSIEILSVALDQVRQRFVWPSRFGIPVIEIETPYYQARVGTFAGNATLDLKRLRLADRTMAVVIRSVGAAGGPIRSLRWDGSQLLINDRWRVLSNPPPAAVRLGEEGTEHWTLSRLDASPASHWTGTSGWGYAVLELARAPSSRVEIHDSHPMPMPSNRRDRRTSEPTSAVFGRLGWQIQRAKHFSGD